MRKCIRDGSAFAFSLGLLAGLVLPQNWVAIVAAVLLVIVSFVTRCRCCGGWC